jgi:hypothetical protein
LVIGRENGGRGANPPLQPVINDHWSLSIVNPVGEISHPVFFTRMGGAFASPILFLFLISAAENFLSGIDSWVVIAVFFHVADFPAEWLSVCAP